MISTYLCDAQEGSSFQFLWPQYSIAFRSLPQILPALSVSLSFIL